MNSARVRPEVGADQITAVFREHPEWLVALDPLVDVARAGLHDRVARLTADAATLGPLVDSPPVAGLSRVALRVFVLHMQVAAANGELRGATPRDRFDHYVHLLRHTELGARLLHRYPVLVRETERLLRRWQDARTEFATHLLADLPAITRRFPQLRRDTLREVTFDHGDATLRFADEQRLVYKPRSMLVDKCFQELVAWTGAQGFAPALAPMWVLDRDNHGWTQHVRHGSCQDWTEAERYYRRLGGHLALLHVVCARDVRIVADGDMPYVVDLERLFHSDPVHEVVAHDRRVELTTVLATGLLPPAHNVARIGDAPTVLGEYAAVLEDGFADMYRLLRDHRAELLAHDGPLLPCAAGTTRVILRDTQFYCDILGQTYHPDLLQDAVDREHHLSRTLEPVLGIAGEDRIVDSERRQLAGGDIPVFHAAIGGTDLVGGDGTRIRKALRGSGMAACLDRVRRLGEKDLARQRWVIRAAVAAPDSDARLPARYGSVSTSQSPPDLFRAAVVDIGDQLLGQAIEIDGRNGWLGLRCTPRTDQWQLSAVGPDLCSGRSGIALYLTHLAAFTGHKRFAAAARRLAHELAEGMDGNVPGLTGTVDGPLCALAEWARLNDEPALALDAFAAVAGPLRDAVGRDTEHDLVMGNASTILALAWLYRACPHPDIRPLVATAAEHLAGARFRPAEGGAAWRPDSLDTRPLTGVAQGASGIALALAMAENLLSTRAYRAIVFDALYFERARFDPTLPGWPDLRPDANPDSALNAWCHGSPGIGLTRLAMFRLITAPAIAADLELSVDATLRYYDEQQQGERVRMTNLSLCHGELGSIGFLAAAARATGDEVLTRRVTGLTHAIASVAERHGYLCGVPSGLSNPGLMTGLAGIGYGMLRVLAPDQVPEVLVMGADL